MMKGFKERLYWAINFLIGKLIINRLPAKAMLWSRFPEKLSALIVGERCLDLGCGQGSQLPLNNLKWYGIDKDFFSLWRASQKASYYVLVCADALSIDRLIRPKSFDTVVALDFIEHLSKSQGYRLIESIERIARCRVIILTPNGYFPQNPRKVNDNPYMDHQSGWTVIDFLNLGYQCRGWSGWKKCAGSHGWIFHNLESLFQILMTITQPFVENDPQHAFHLLCWKDIE